MTKKGTNKEIDYHDDNHEKFVEHPELDLMLKEYKEFESKRNYEFLRTLVWTLLKVVFAMVIFFIIIFFVAKNQAGV